MDLSTTAPLFSKEGLGEILQSVIKIPLSDPPLQKGDLKGKFLESMTLACYQIRGTLSGISCSGNHQSL
jgi:hypothetical protein